MLSAKRILDGFGKHTHSLQEAVCQQAIKVYCESHEEKLITFFNQTLQMGDTVWLLHIYIVSSQNCAYVARNQSLLLQPFQGFQSPLHIVHCNQSYDCILESVQSRVAYSIGIHVKTLLFRYCSHVVGCMCNVQSGLEAPKPLYTFPIRSPLLPSLAGDLTLLELD